ncbi:MAG: helix-turn-helix transcriptional regulator [Hyalangium sp.]
MRRARNRLRLTTEELATSVGMTVEDYERIERGNFPSSPKAFLDLVVALRVPADELLIALSPPRLYVIRGGKSKNPSP